jgi:predicted RNA binding protein YcfA (HicA-like mRNA interferase family)
MGHADLPEASGSEHEKAFHRFGWVTRKNGNHIIMTHANVFGVTLSIPNHQRVKKATLQSLLRSAGIDTRLYRQVFDGK